MKFRDIAWGALIYKNQNKRSQGESIYDNLIDDNEFLQNLIKGPSLADFNRLRDFLVHFGVRHAPKDIASQYLHVWPDLQPYVNILRNEVLDICDLTNIKIQNAIKSAFGLLQWPHVWGGDTSASKALHFFNIHLFVMWDTDIRAEYGKFGAQGYLEFLQEMQIQAKAIMTDFNRLSLHGSAEGFLSQSLIYPINRPLTKFLDQYNWIIIYWGWPPSPPNWFLKLYGID